MYSVQIKQIEQVQQLPYKQAPTPQQQQPLQTVGRCQGRIPVARGVEEEWEDLVDPEKQEDKAVWE
ncbi:unnamed protein product [Paramecium sonneborni]|uniref:Uncharacterized protein n=1 Tax=Paramecium sonneborni TaxID=65129 RepID=A0A8S1RDU1_9CILI|nr:unnamed protein product [Paramecium sonneborni]